MSAFKIATSRITCVACKAPIQYRKCMSKIPVRHLSSVAEKRRNLQTHEILSMSRPIDHDDDDLTKAYRISIKDMKNIFTHGFPTRIGNRVIDFKDFHMLIRKPSLDVIKAIRNIKDGDEPQRFVFYGDDGTGKSIALSHVIHFCSYADWLVLHVPAVHTITNSKEPTEPSSWKEGRLDQPQEAAYWLKAFKTVNHRFVDTLTTSQDYKWGRQELIPMGSSISKVVDTGMARANFATDAVGIVIKEVINKEKLNVLYAVDDFNKLFAMSAIVHNKQHVHAQHLSLVRHFTRILEPGKSLPSGCYVMALSRTGSFGKYTQSFEIKEQLGEKGMVALGEHTPVLVGNLDKTELHNYLLLLKETEMFHKEINEQLEQEVFYLTERNPADINRLFKGQ